MSTDHTLLFLIDLQLKREVCDTRLKEQRQQSSKIQTNAAREVIHIKEYKL